jgi:hypothetical protein
MLSSVLFGKGFHLSVTIHLLNNLIEILVKAIFEALSLNISFTHSDLIGSTSTVLYNLLFINQIGAF